MAKASQARGSSGRWGTLAVVGVLLLLVFLVLPALRGQEGRYGCRKSPSTAGLTLRGDGGALAPGRRAARPRPAAGPSWGPAAVALSPGEDLQDVHAMNGAFSGRVLSAATGEPVGGALLSFERGGALHGAVAGADGRFRFVAHEPGLYTLAVVAATGFLPFAPELGQSPIVLAARPVRRVDEITVRLRPAIEYLGKVVDPQGGPVSGAEVRLLASGAGEHGLTPFADRFVSDARGEFRFHAPDDALLEARHQRFAPGRARLGFSAQASHKLLLRLRPAGDPEAALTSRIEGQVLGLSRPLEGARVSGVFLPQNPGDPRGQLTPEVSAVTDAGGRFVLEGLAAGRYRLTASSEGLAPASVTVLSGRTDALLRLAPGGRLAGRVRDARSTRPVVAFAVHLGQKQGPIARATLAVRTFFDADGHFLIEDLPPGPLLVQVVAHGHAPSAEQAVEIEVDPAQAPRELTFDLALGGRLHGTVSSRGTGQPIAGARVSREGRLGEGSSAAPLFASAISDARGAFELLGIGPGAHSLSVAAKDHHGRVLSGLTLGEDGQLGPIKVELTPTRPGEEPRLELVGIGVVLAAKDDALVIGQVVPGGGAAEAGLGTGDAVVSVEGETVVSLGFEEAIGRIRGPEGTRVRLGIRKGGAGDPMEVEVPRRPLAH